MPRIELRGALDETYYENLGEESEKGDQLKMPSVRPHRMQGRCLIEVTYLLSENGN